MVMLVSVKWWKIALAGTVLLTGCGTFTGSQVPPASSLALARPETFPAVTGFSFASVAPELEGAVTALSLHPHQHLSAVISWANVPNSASFLSWQPQAPHVRITPYFHVSTPALSETPGMISGGQESGRNFIAVGSRRYTWSSAVTNAPRWISASPTGVIDAAASNSRNQWAIIRAVPTGPVSVHPLSVGRARVVAIHQARGGVWVATTHPNQILLWYPQGIAKIYPVPGVVTQLLGFDPVATHKTSKPRNLGITALIASPQALPGTANMVVTVTHHGVSTHTLPLSWLISSARLPFLAGVSRGMWVSPHHLLLTLWDSGLNQVAIARLDLTTGRATIFPHSQFQPRLFSAEPPVFPVTESPSSHLIVVGQGYGLAFYFPSHKVWAQFMK